MLFCPLHALHDKGAEVEGLERIRAAGDVGAHPFFQTLPGCGDFGGDFVQVFHLLPQAAKLAGEAFSLQLAGSSQYLVRLPLHREEPLQAPFHGGEHPLCPFVRGRLLQPPAEHPHVPLNHREGCLELMGDMVDGLCLCLVELLKLPVGLEEDLLGPLPLRHVPQEDE